MINFCPNCKSIINAGATFCTKCGVNILDFNEKRETPQKVEVIEETQSLQRTPLSQEKSGKVKINTTPTKANLPKTYFSVISALFIIAGCINLIYGIATIVTSILAAFAISSGIFSILIGVTLMKVDEILWDFRNNK